MQKVYRYVNCMVYVDCPDTYDLDRFKTQTESFLRKVIEERLKHGNSDTTRDFKEEQILDK